MRTVAALFCVALALLTPCASAHVGPPFPIISDHKIGACVISLWTHPDVGTGTFFVMVNPASGQQVPRDLKIAIGVQPVTGRLLEARYNMERESLRGQVQFNASVPFDKQELWRATVFLTGAPSCTGEASATVEVTPPGLGSWDLLLFSLPFLGIGLLWFRVLAKKKRRSKRPSAAPAQS